VKDATPSPVQIHAMCEGYRIAEHRKTSRILVHGNMGFRAIQSVAEANFPTEIHEVMLSSVCMFMVTVLCPCETDDSKLTLHRIFKMDVFQVSFIVKCYAVCICVH
jgi:hypothetical protein